MLVGPSGAGKSAAWRVLINALSRCDKTKGDSYVIDPKAISKEDLYGRLDPTTLDWTDGIFTSIVRKIVENQRGESQRRHWIVFDGDVDPEWAENLNSVLDDNKLLTLPNGERLAIPPNVRILFEVETLKYATLATVSRCGMVWFNTDILAQSDVFHHYLERLKAENYDEKEIELDDASGNPAFGQQGGNANAPEIRKKCVSYIQHLFDGDASFVNTALSIAETDKDKHVMEFTRIRVLEASFALVRKGIGKILEWNESRPDFELSDAIMEKFITKWSLISFNWGLAGDMKLGERTVFWNKLKESVNFTIPLPETNGPQTLIDYEVKVEDGEWVLWKKKVPYLDLEPDRVLDADLIITTVDTLRHQEILCAWLSEHRPFLLCGPPGSGKTMSLMSTLKGLPDFEMIFINFSSSTTPLTIQKQFDHYCEYTKTHQGVILRPKQPNKWLVVFCDEINLPDMDVYGTQKVITFLRQLTEQQGFWRTHDKTWVKLERIQFVGACNPPTDVGRNPLSDRFLRHVPLIMIDFPGYDSLTQIYGTFNRAMLKKVPTLKSHADSLTKAMVDYYTESQKRFTSDMQPHYIYSPRELTRWKTAINEA
jgi:dynein heavy chain 1